MNSAKETSDSVEGIFSADTLQFFHHAIDDVGESKLKLNARKTLGSLEHLRIDIERIKEVDSTESKAGGQGTVVPSILRPEGVFAGGDKDGPSSHFIAVKKAHFKPERKGRIFAQFAYEILLLSKLSHKNIIHAVGFVEDVEAGVAWMVFGWEANGNMREFVASAKLELPERLWLIRGVAEGLAYLHELNPPICHGDLKSLNILINEDFSAVITDFGSARAIIESHNTEATRTAEALSKQKLTQEVPSPGNLAIQVSSDCLTLTGQNGTILWSAPELLEHDHFDLATDVWAFGWICWEAITGNFPFHDHDHDPSPREDVGIIVRIVKGELPVLKNDAELKQLRILCSQMEDCWRGEAVRRPSARQCQWNLDLMGFIKPHPRKPGTGDEEAYSSDLLRSLGSIRMDNGQTQEAMKYLKRSLEVAEAAECHHDAARALLSIGICHWRESNEAEAEVYYVLARNAFAQNGDQQGEANAIHCLGEVYQMRGDDAKAEGYYILARDTHSRIGNQIGTANALHCLGEVYRERGDDAKAEGCYILARDTHSRTCNHLGMANALHRLGEVYQRRGDDAKAEECYMLARDTFIRVGHEEGMAHLAGSLGDVHLQSGEYAKAEECYILARDAFTRVGDQLHIAEAFICLGNLYSIREEYDRAEEAFISAGAIASRIDARSMLDASAEGLQLVRNSRASA